MKELKNVLLHTGKGVDFLFDFYSDGPSACFSMDRIHKYEIPFILVRENGFYRVYGCVYLRYSYLLTECVYETKFKYKALDYLKGCAIDAVDVSSFIFKS